MALSISALSHGKSHLFILFFATDKAASLTFLVVNVVDRKLFTRLPKDAIHLAFQEAY
jgi:hypothetical protein